MKLKSLLICLSLILSTSVFSQAISQTKYGDNDPTNLSDQDKDLSENFIHDGKLERVYVEECTKSKSDEAACLGQSATKNNMIGMLAKAYTMVIGMTDLGGGIELADTKKATDTATEGAKETTKEGADKAKDTKEKKDYCKYIPVATEAIAMFNTTSDQKQIGMLPNSVESAQKDSLLKAAENHESRAKTAKIQTTGWGAGTACYIGMNTFGGGAWVSWQNGLKLASSALLTAYYGDQVGKHQDYADKTRAIADKLPGKGDCNPITDKTCFCTEESSKKRPDYGKYCQPHLHTRPVAYKSERVTCIDENMKEDPACTCSARDTCVDKKVMTVVKGFGGGTLGSSPMLADFSQLAKGELTQKSLGDASSTVKSAFAKLREIDRKLPESNTILTAKQKEEFNLLRKSGIPPKIAKKMASINLPASAQKNLGKFNGASGNSFSRSGSNRYKKTKKSNVLRFSGGDGINKAKEKKRSNSNDLLRRLGLNKKKKRTKKNGQVLKFAQRAQNQAQISNNKNRHIFDIISRRYQVSGWKRLEYIKD